MASTRTIKTVYSFIAATILIDAASPFGKALIGQLIPFATQNLSQSHPPFKQLYDQVERENTPHVLGTGMAASPEGFAGAFVSWLESMGVNIEDFNPLIGTEVFVFGGDAQNPQDGSSFAWSVSFYFDIES
ncbi:MAG: hypothetical protein V3T35_05755 [Spirochaetia bacterium]